MKRHQNPKIPKTVKTRVYFAVTEGKGQDRKIKKTIKKFDRRVKGLTGIVQVGREKYYLPVAKGDTQKDLFLKKLLLKREKERDRVLSQGTEKKGYIDHVSIGAYWKKLDKPYRDTKGRIVKKRYAERKISTRIQLAEKKIGNTVVKEYQYKSGSNVPQAEILDKALGLNRLKDKRSFKKPRVYLRMDFKGSRGKEKSYFLQGKMGQTIEIDRLKKERFRKQPHLKRSAFYRQYGVVAEMLWALRTQARRNNWFFSGATFRPQKWTGARYHTIPKFDMYVRVEYDTAEKKKK